MATPTGARSRRAPGRAFPSTTWRRRCSAACAPKSPRSVSSPCRAARSWRWTPRLSLPESPEGAVAVSRFAQVWAFVRLGRPLFLGGGFVLYGLGAAVAAAHGVRLNVALYALGQAVVTALQLMTHYANDYFD